MRLPLIIISLLLLVSCDVRADSADAPSNLSQPDSVPQRAACYAGAGTARFRRSGAGSADYDLTGPQRVEAARKSKLATLKAMLKARGLSWPPRQVFLRGYKKEGVLEVWASNKPRGALTHLATYEICYASGGPGPKTRQGDSQVPEGFYRLDYYKRDSSYFLAARINYPNLRDRRLGHTGGAIMIHGACVSIGCVSMGDEGIQEIWLLARAAHRAGRAVHVHLFPSCDLDPMIKEAGSSRLKNFWAQLKRGRDLFDQDKVVPSIGVDKWGNYTFPRIQPRRSDM